MNRKRILSGLLFACLAAWALAGTVFTGMMLPHGRDREAVTIDIPPGTSTREISRLLEERGIVSSRWWFLAARVFQPRAKLLAGEYRFERAISPWSAFRKLARGEILYHRFTIPEGYNRFEVAGILADGGFVDRDEFLKLANSPELIRDLDPRARNLEGYLFPETYSIPKGLTAAALAKLMVDRFRVELEAARGSDPAELSVHDAVTLASMIEKETGNGGERGLVSSVFHNRLRIGMPMQCDPTVIYGMVLEGRYKGYLLSKHLTEAHEYNTYIRPGLPPGPIANPGRASIEATFHPESSGYLYFVAESRDAGTHVFSETLAAHQRAVAQYRRSR